MSEPRATAYIKQMRSAALDAQAFVAGIDKGAFLTDRKTQHAVVMSLMITSEAAARMMEREVSVTARHPYVPWASLRGLRNRIAHGYFGIDMGHVWTTVHEALPDLLEKLQGLTWRPIQFVSLSIIG